MTWRALEVHHPSFASPVLPGAVLGAAAAEALIPAVAVARRRGANVAPLRAWTGAASALGWTLLGGGRAALDRTLALAGVHGEIFLFCCILSSV